MPLQTVYGTALIRDDARADDRQREVAFGERSVVIARRVAGIAMRVRVPLASYRGVRLSLGAQGEGESLHRIDLLHRDPDLSIPLFQTADTGVLAAEWDSWAKSLSLPLLFEDFPARGSEEAPSPAPRRRGSAVAQRRTRFSRRRKLGAPERLAIAYRDEREIISYD